MIRRLNTGVVEEYPPLVLSGPCWDRRRFRRLPGNDCVGDLIQRQPRDGASFEIAIGHSGRQSNHLLSVMPLEREWLRNADLPEER